MFLLQAQPLVLLGALASAAVTFCLFIYALERFVISIPYPDNIPLIREKEGARRFSLRTRLAYYVDCRALFNEAWNDYLKHGKPVVLPGMGFRKEVILPPNMMRWVLAQPLSRLDVGTAMAEMDQAKWTLGHEGPVTDSWQGLLVKTEMNRVLEGVCVGLNDELGRAFDKHFAGDADDWVELDLRQTIGRAIAQANSRFTVGLPLCRDPAYLRTVLDINDSLLSNAGMIIALPRVLQPILGRLIGLNVQRKISQVKKWLAPLWRDRIALARAAEKEGKEVELPLDHVQMMVKYALRERPQEIEDVELIVRRISAQTFGAVHQTALQVCNLILDILGSDAEYDTIAALRKESDAILSQDGEASGQWTKARVNSMVLADSASRETLRLHSFANRVMMRKVMVDGLATPDGHHLPRGTLISFLSHPAHTDEKLYSDPLKYKPFRFAQLRDKDGNNAPTTTTPLTFVTTSTDFLPFGHGKHACPGRFLVDFELKMIVAHVLRNYDIKFPADYEGKRPPNVWITEATFPPDGARICVRKRKKT